MNPIKIPTYSLKIKSKNRGKYIFDPVRKKYISLTPEEIVRQNFIEYLMKEKGYPASLMAVEMYLKINNLSRRCDIVLHDLRGNPVIITECKSPIVNLNQKVFDQIARYNMSLRVRFLVVTNGPSTYCCQVDFQDKSYHFLNQIPSFDDIHLLNSPH